LAADSGDGGFDNNAAALTISPSLASDEPTSQGEPACAAAVATGFAAKAWRRPLEAGEAAGLTAVYTAARAAGLTFDDGVKFLLEAILLSPHFLFRPELDQLLDSPTQHAVDPYELATRLSYFLWSSLPDSALAPARRLRRWLSAQRTGGGRQR